jgi:hypothetical protein
MLRDCAPSCPVLPWWQAQWWPPLWDLPHGLRVAFLLNARYVSTYLIRIYVSKLTAVLAKAIQPVLGKCFGDLKPSFACFQFNKT